MLNLSISLPDGFLDEEVRCGYTVSAEMKKVWAVELDLLAQLQTVCDRYGLKYTASGGTMLGAVRHKGFIPWDDDIDIMMMRDQYDELCKHADEFPEPYFFQTTERDRGYYVGHAKLRNSMTTGIQKRSLPRGRRYNQGIFIDIFPMDVIPDDDNLRKEQGEKCTYYKKKTRRIYYLIDFPAETVRRKLKKAAYTVCDLVYPHIRYYEKFEQWCRKYNDTDFARVSKLCLQAEDERLYQDRTDFDSFLMMDFEMLKIPVISNYDRMLRYKYGDYMQFAVNQGYHGDMLFDPETPYPETIRRINEERAVLT